MLEESVTGLTHHAGSSQLLLSSGPVHRKPLYYSKKGQFLIASAHLAALGLYKAFLSGVLMVFSTVFF